MIYRLLGGGYRGIVDEWIRYSGTRVTPRGFANYSFAFSLCLGLIFGLYVRGLFLLIFLAGFLGMFALIHGFLLLAVEKRTKFVENILPDALQLMAANSRAGYIPSRALILSTRKEFGPLSDAIKNVGKELATGENLEESLTKITRYIKSELLERTVKLINEGIKSGGEFASLLEENANDIRRMQAIKKEMKANITMYTIFIAFAGSIGAPVLYALSGFLMSTITSLMEKVSVPEAAALTNTPFMKFGGVEISPDFLFTFSLLAIIITTVFGSLIIGLIGTGKEKSGIKYLPVFLVLGVAVFFTARMVIAGLFGTLMP